MKPTRPTFNILARTEKPSRQAQQEPVSIQTDDVAYALKCYEIFIRNPAYVTLEIRINGDLFSYEALKTLALAEAMHG